MKNIILFLVILVNSLIINYINKLDEVDCECSKNWYRKFLLYYSYITIFISIFIITNLQKFINKKIYNICELIYHILGILNVYILFKFTQDIMKQKCVCSNSWDKQIIYYYSLISTTMCVILFIISVCRDIIF